MPHALPVGQAKVPPFWHRAPTLAVAGIRRTWRDFGPCRVRLARVTDGAHFQLFLTAEEQFANLQVGKNLLRACPEKLRDGRLKSASK